MHNCLISGEQTKKKRQNSRQNIFDRRTLQVSEGNDDKPQNMNSIEIVNQHNRQQQNRFSTTTAPAHVNDKPMSMSIEDEHEDDHHDDASVMEPGHELYFRRMPFVYEEFHDTSIYSPF